MRAFQLVLSIFVLAGCANTVGSSLLGSVKQSAPLEATIHALPRSSVRSTAATYVSLFSFNGVDGSYPAFDLTALGGKLYGATQSGGTGGHGTIYSITTSGAENVLYAFKGASNGGDPSGGVFPVRGSFYGTTRSARLSQSSGTFFMLTATGKEDVLHLFEGVPDGAQPEGNLIDVSGIFTARPQ